MTDEKNLTTADVTICKGSFIEIEMDWITPNYTELPAPVSPYAAHLFWLHGKLVP